MNIHDVLKEDDVCGQIIGSIASVGFLSYDGRQQGQTIYAENESELKRKAEVMKNEIINDMGEAFKLIYPGDNWKLVILQ